MTASGTIQPSRCRVCGHATELCGLTNVARAMFVVLLGRDKADCADERASYLELDRVPIPFTMPSNVKARSTMSTDDPGSSHLKFSQALVALA